MPTSISDHDLNEAAFRLLSSSSVARYRDMAESMAQRVFRTELCVDQDSFQARVTEATDLWSQIVGDRVRSLQEVRLAVILCSIAQAPGTSVDVLVKTIALSDPPQALWLSALARDLLRTRPSNVTYSTSQIRSPNTFVGTINVSPVVIAASDAPEGDVFVGDRSTATSTFQLVEV